MQVTLCDVGPRDGLQNEPDVLAPEVRAELVNRLAAAGLPRVEAVSFVRDDRVPQMAGAEEVVSHEADRSEEHTSELQSLRHLVCRLLLEKKKHKQKYQEKAEQ